MSDDPLLNPVCTVRDLQAALASVPPDTEIRAFAGMDSSVIVSFRDGRDWRDLAYFRPDGDD